MTHETTPRAQPLVGSGDSEMVIAGQLGRNKSAVTFCLRSCMLLLLLFHSLISPPCCNAQTLPLPISQYAHNAWRLQDGVLDGAPQAIAQTTDGYLWIGTTAGLVRFNGVSFVPIKTGFSSQDPVVYSLRASRDGSLWIGGGSSLAHLKNGVITIQAAPSARYNAILQDHAGGVWVTRSRIKGPLGALCQVRGSGLRCFGPSEGLPCETSTALSEDTLGALWVADANLLCSWKDGASKTYATAGFKTMWGIEATAVLSDGSVIAAFPEAGHDMGVRRLVAGHLANFQTPGFDGSTIDASYLLQDQRGALWIGTESKGLFHLDHGRVDHYAQADGLSSNTVENIFEDREGDIWVATEDGLDEFHQVTVRSFSTEQGFNSGHITAVLASRDGEIFAGSSDGLQILKDGKASALLSGKQVTAIAEDASGALWVGIRNGLTRYSHGTAESIKPPEGGSLSTNQMIGDNDGSIWAKVLDSKGSLFRIHKNLAVSKIDFPPRVNSFQNDLSGDIWISSSQGYVYHHHDDSFLVIGPAPGEPHLNTLIFDGPNSFWAASTKGLYRYHEARWAALTLQNGLPCPTIYSMLQDLRGSLWLQTNCGFVTLTLDDLKHWWLHPNDVLRPKLYGMSDGARPGFSTFFPDAARSTTGQLYFANDSALQMIDPANLVENHLPPPVHVEQFSADGKLYALDKAIVLPPLTHDVTIDYSALSLVIPRMVRFRYRLSGIDKDWQDAGNRRQAFFMNLRPGHYLFQVIACNNDGVWNESGGQIRFTIRPAFYQTMWFLLLSIGTALLLLWVAFRVRLRNATAIVESRLGERLLERERIARELHDTLLQGFQALLLNLHMAVDAIPECEPAKNSFLPFLKQGDETLMEGRERVHDLRSHEHSVVDLPELIEKVIIQLQTLRGPSLALTLTGSPRAVSLVVAEEATLFVREAMSNAIRHARANRVTCDIYFGRGKLRVIVEDDGAGIPAGALRAGGVSGHWGLIGMKERAKKLEGKLKIVTGSTGTHIELCVPQRVAFSKGKTTLLERMKSLFFPLHQPR